MAIAISTTVYDFSAPGNKLRKTYLQAIPTPIQVVAAVSPDPACMIYSKIIFEMPRGIIQEAYSAESISSLVTKANS